MSRWTLIGLGLLSLACAGLPDPDVGDVPLGTPVLLVLAPEAGRCAWTLRDLQGNVRPLGETPSCPEDVRRSPDGSQLLAYDQEKVWIGPFPPRALQEVPAPPDLHAVWARPDGGVGAGAVRYGEQGATAVLYALDGDRFVERAAVPAAEGAEMGVDPLSIEHPDLAEAPGWRALRDDLARNEAKVAELEAPPASVRAAVSAGEADAVGQIESVGTNLTFRVEWGDTPHPRPPLAWCSAPTCASPTRLTGPLPDTLAVQAREGFVLITEEWSGKRAAVYRPGEAAPVLTLPPDAVVAWE